MNRHKELDGWVKILKDMAGDLPHDIEIKPDYETHNILVCNEKLAFCVTAQAMRDGLYKAAFPQALKHLYWCLENEDLSDPRWHTPLTPTVYMHETGVTVDWSTAQDPTKFG